MMEFKEMVSLGYQLILWSVELDHVTDQVVDLFLEINKVGLGKIT